MDIDFGMIFERCLNDDFVIVGRVWNGDVVERDVDDGVFVNGNIVIYQHSLGTVNEDSAGRVIRLGRISYDDVVGFSKRVDRCLKVGGRRWRFAGLIGSLNRSLSYVEFDKFLDEDSHDGSHQEIKQRFLHERYESISVNNT